MLNSSIASGTADSNECGEFFPMAQLGHCLSGTPTQYCTHSPCRVKVENTNTPYPPASPPSSPPSAPVDPCVALLATYKSACANEITMLASWDPDFTKRAAYRSLCDNSTACGHALAEYLSPTLGCNYGFVSSGVYALGRRELLDPFQVCHHYQVCDDTASYASTCGVTNTSGNVNPHYHFSAAQFDSLCTEGSSCAQAYDSLYTACCDNSRTFSCNRAYLDLTLDNSRASACSSCYRSAAANFQACRAAGVDPSDFTRSTHSSSLLVPGSQIEKLCGDSCYQTMQPARSACATPTGGGGTGGFPYYSFQPICEPYRSCVSGGGTTADCVREHNSRLATSLGESTNVKVQFTLSGDVTDYGAAEQAAIIRVIAAAAFVSPSAVAIDIRAGSVVIIAVIAVGSSANIDATQTALFGPSRPLSSASSLTAALRAEGSLTSVSAEGQPTLAQDGDGDPCFPSSALVTKANGSQVPMTALSVGDEILAIGLDGAVFLDTVSQLSVARPERRAATFLTLTTDAGHHLTLTAEHHLPVGSGCCSTLKRASTVEIGETLWMLPSSSQVALAAPTVIPQPAKAVKAVKVVWKTEGVRAHGLHSPVPTNGGLPVVDGFVTSFDSLSQVKLAQYALPALLQACEVTGTCELLRRTIVSAN